MNYLFGIWGLDFRLSRAKAALLATTTKSTTRRLFVIAICFLSIAWKWIWCAYAYNALGARDFFPLPIFLPTNSSILLASTPPTMKPAAAPLIDDLPEREAIVWESTSVKWARVPFYLPLDAAWHCRRASPIISAACSRYHFACILPHGSPRRLIISNDSY